MAQSLQRCETMESPLLKLPGEIRNHIYEFVAGDEVVKIKLKQCDFDVGSPDDMDMSPSLSISFSKDTGDEDGIESDQEKSAAGTYAGLTRVCRQIREEFLPIHRRNARVSLAYNDLEGFLSTFFDADDPIKELQIFVSDTTDEDLSMDVLPILRARARFPFRFDCKVIRIDGNEVYRYDSFFVDNLESLLEKRDPSWVKMLSDTACTIKAIYTSHMDSYIDIFLNQHFTTTNLTSRTKALKVFSRMGFMDWLYLTVYDESGQELVSSDNWLS